MRLLSLIFLLTWSSCVLRAQNLIANGDFELGNQGFTSAYTYSATNLTPAQTYSVLKLPKQAHSLFANPGDHTTGNGFMMVVNGSDTPPQPVVWAQEVNVTPGTDYTFSIWASNLYGANPSQLEMRINGVVLPPLANVPIPLGDWTNFSRTWNSGAATTARLEIAFATTSYAGNDTALDDFSFSAADGPCLPDARIPAGFEYQKLSADVTVPGRSNPFLAGHPDGTTAKADNAPAQSPVLATAVTSGDILSFSATGSVSYGGATNPTIPPDGGSVGSSASEVGIAGYTGASSLPIDALVGVFLTDAIPANPAPPVMEYPEGLDFEVLAPGNNQIFYIGDGLTGRGTGTRQQFVVPSGATRLFLGTTDGYGWYNNSGAFEVKICRLRNVAAGSRLVPTEIRFDKPAYTADQGVPVKGSIIIDPVPVGGLYSQGMIINVSNREGTVAGVITPVTNATLDHHGIIPNSPADTSTSTGTGGLKGSGLFSPALPVLSRNELATFTLTGLPAGVYDLRISPWNQLGPTEDIFVTAYSETLDPFITFVPSTVEITGMASVPEVTVTGNVTLNPQTGLLEQNLTLTNTTGQTLHGFRLYVTGLPEGVILWNRHGYENGIPYIDIFGDILPGASINILLEYYRPSRIADFTPGFNLSPQEAEPEQPGDAPPLALDLRILRIDSRGLLVEFKTLAEKRYTVQYSDDLSVWKVSQPSIEGTGERIQWLDAGPPKTATFPNGTRFYRIVESD